MKTRHHFFDEYAVLQELKSFLPAVEPWGKLSYRNPLQGFQDLNFHDALRNAYEMTGFRTILPLETYRSFYNAKKVKPEVLERVIVERKGTAATFEWQDKVLMKKYPATEPPKIGSLRACWKEQFGLDPDSRIHPTLFRILGSYLDQGHAAWPFPVSGQGFLDSMREMESYAMSGILKTARARNLLLHTLPDIADLLALLVGDEQLFRQYLFDQQFAHRGWSGLVTRMEERTGPLPGDREISLRDLVIFELLLEIDMLDHRLNGKWEPLASGLESRPADLFAPTAADEKSEVLSIWQEALEWSCYEPVLTRFQQSDTILAAQKVNSVTAFAVSGEPPATICLIGHQFPGQDRQWMVSGMPYDYASDHGGEKLETILSTIAPSFSAVNLEYFFSRTNQDGKDKPYTADDYLTGLGAIADGLRGDLRTGLPGYLLKDYEPMRLLLLVEQMPDTVMNVITRLPFLHAWLNNEWLHLVAVDPDSRELRVFRNGEMTIYKADRRIVEDAVH